MRTKNLLLVLIFALAVTIPSTGLALQFNDLINTYISSSPYEGSLSHLGTTQMDTVTSGNIDYWRDMIKNTTAIFSGSSGNYTVSTWDDEPLNPVRESEYNGLLKGELAVNEDGLTAGLAEGDTIYKVDWKMGDTPFTTYGVGSGSDYKFEPTIFLSAEDPTWTGGATWVGPEGWRRAYYTVKCTVTEYPCYIPKDSVVWEISSWHTILWDVQGAETQKSVSDVPCPHNCAGHGGPCPYCPCDLLVTKYTVGVCSGLKSIEIGGNPITVAIEGFGGCGGVQDYVVNHQSPCCTPEPSTCLLFFFGVLGMVGIKKKIGKG
ncbi:MAG: PEP-CTERM sorting domain-containing protein [bacterium]